MNERNYNYDYNSHDFDVRRAKKKLAMSHARKFQTVPHVTLNGMEMKSCSKCGSLKHVPDDFHKDKRSTDGLTYQCKSCLKAYSRNI